MLRKYRARLFGRCSGHAATGLNLRQELGVRIAIVAVIIPYGLENFKLPALLLPDDLDDRQSRFRSIETPTSYKDLGWMLPDRLRNSFSRFVSQSVKKLSRRNYHLSFENPAQLCSILELPIS
jgi:hypothetical protein